MGASSSMIATRDHNVEMNIIDEAKSNGRASIQRHSSQPASTIFSTFKPRQKHQDSTLRATNLRSSGSFDPSTPPAVGPVETVGNVRKEYDTLKLTKEQEIQALQRKEQKLDMENNRLRAELHALNKQCQKLRAERDTAMESSYLATERATALEQDREKIQRQFKIFRETKETEIRTLLQAKRQLEYEFQRLQAHGMATIDDHNSITHDTSFSGQSSHTESAGDHSNWWAVPESETTSLFGSHVQLQNGSQVGYSESVQDGQEIRKLNQRQDVTMELTNLTSTNDTLLSTSTSLSNMLVADASEICDSTILRCYISASPDSIDEAKFFLNHSNLRKLKLACEKEGYFLSIVHFTDIQDYSDVSGTLQQNYHIAVIHALNRCSVFISFLGSSMGKYTETELNEALFKSSATKCTLFCIKKSGDTRRPNQNLVEMVQSHASKRCVNYSSKDQCCQAALKEVSKAVRLEFGVSVDSNSSSSILDSHEVVCLDEMVMEPHVERTQIEIASLSSNLSHIQSVGLEKCHDRLDEVITSPGHVPPLLVSGSPSSGKTMLLSSWAAKLKVNHPDVVVLQHFVTNPNSIDSKPVIVLRRLLSQLCQHLPNGTHLPLYACTTYDATRLREIFPRWIDQLSSRRNKRILLIIDSIDRIKDVQRYFSWIIDHLPVRVRVVISVDVDSCPEEWRQLSTLHLEPLSIHGVKNLIKEHGQKRNVVVTQAWLLVGVSIILLSSLLRAAMEQRQERFSELRTFQERDIVSHCRTATTCHPLYVTLLTAIACSICEDRASVNLFHLCSKKQDSREVYHILLRDVEVKCANKEAKQRFKVILQVIVCSRNGLSETELMSIFPDLTWFEWTWLYGQLSQFCVLKEQAGVVVAHNSEISILLYNKYVGNDVYERRCRQKMITWMLRVHEHQVTPRSTELLLWLLQRDEERSTLLDVLKSPLVFHILYTSGRNSEMVELWNYLNEDKQAIAKYYSSELRTMEKKTQGQVTRMTEVARMYQTLGRFLKDMGLMEEAVASLQKSLEIQETVLDPDHPAVADTLHYLAAVYSQWGKLTTAQSLYKQALELIESVVGRDHLRVAQELGALSRIARKMGNQEEAESLHRRETAIANRSSTVASTRLERLRKRALRLEELTLSEDSVEVANALNDLGVLYFLQNNLENAESFFLRCLKMREKLMGSHHIEVAQSYHNLASLYNQKKNYVQAVKYMNKALKIRRKHCGDDVSVVTSLKHMAVLYKKLKQFDQAREIYEQLLEISIKSTGEKTDLTANAMVNLAVVECQNGNLDVALPLYRKALKIYQDTFGKESPQASQTLKNIALLLFQKGDLTEAALLYKESMGDKLDQAKLAKLTR